MCNFLNGHNLQVSSLQDTFLSFIKLSLWESNQLPGPVQGNKAYQAPQFIPQTSPKAASAAQFTPTAGAGPHQFMPQAPGLGGFSSMGHPQQPQAPAAPPKPAAPPAPVGPPANVNITNVDTTKVYAAAVHGYGLLRQPSDLPGVIHIVGTVAATLYAESL